MSSFRQLYARLALDTSTQHSLFTASFFDATTLTLTLDPSAEGTANFAIFQNKKSVVNKRVTAGESVTYTGEGLTFYVNYYDGSDLPRVNVTANA